MSYQNGAKKRLEEIAQDKAAAVEQARESLAAIKTLLEEITESSAYKLLPDSGIIKTSVTKILAAIDEALAQ